MELTCWACGRSAAINTAGATLPTPLMPMDAPFANLSKLPFSPLTVLRLPCAMPLPASPCHITPVTPDTAPCAVSHAATRLACYNDEHDARTSACCDSSAIRRRPRARLQHAKVILPLSRLTVVYLAHSFNGSYAATANIRHASTRLIPRV